MPDTAPPAETQIRACPKCGQKNRVPIRPAPGGVYKCGSCGKLLAAGARPVPRWVLVLLGLWIAWLAVVALFNTIGPERWLVTAVNLYVPQWVWALPALVFIPLLAVKRSRLVAIPLVAALYVAFPLSGFTLSFPRPQPSPVTLRVMTFNVKWGARDPQGLADEVARQNPDIVQFQDAGGVMDDPVAAVLHHYNWKVDGQYVIASRYPLTNLTQVDISFPGSDHHVTRCTLNVDGTPVTLYDVHLLTPRFGLVGIRHHNIGPMQDSVDERVFEAQRLETALSGEHGPLLVTGDFNAPIQSEVCRGIMSLGLSDAFYAAGRGYGYSYGKYTKVSVPYVRIDHIFMSRHFNTLRCWSTSDTLSDHIGVIADIQLVVNK